MSLWTHGDTNLDEYKSAIVQSGFYGMECVFADGHVEPLRSDTCDGHWYDGYPIGGPALASPLIVAAVGVMHALHPIFRHFHSTMPMVEGFFQDDYDKGHAVIEMEVASALMAASAVMMYFIAKIYLPDRRALWLAILFAIGTSAYSTAGRGLWQHTPSMLLLTIIIYMLIRAEGRPSLAAWAGLPVALAYTVRPTDALFVVIFTLFVAIRHTKRLIFYFACAAPVAAAFLAYNFATWHQMFSPYYQLRVTGYLPRNWPRWGAALAGDLISPGRGLLLFTPVFLFSIWSMMARKWKAPIAGWLAALAFLQWLVVAALIGSWWGGHCYGPRFFTDVAPIFVLFLIPFFAQWDHLHKATRIAFVVCALASVAIHVRGGWSVAVYRWNAEPQNIDRHPERLWNWRDPQFLR